MSSLPASTENFAHFFDNCPLYDFPVHCPYGLPRVAVYRQNIFTSLPDHIMAAFLDQGFRRNGNTMYTMACRECRSCIPIRLKPEEFWPNRNQKRVWKRNHDVTVDMAPLRITGEKLSLLEKFLRVRYPTGDSSALGYYSDFFINSLTNTQVISYRINDRLMGVAIVDVGGTCVNGVYFYFDSDFSKRSPGTFNILYLIDFCRKQQLEYFYLGLLIREVRAMSYKENFKPHYLRIHGDWQRGEDGDPVAKKGVTG